jgi:hypothetical protein
MFGGKELGPFLLRSKLSVICDGADDVDDALTFK